MDSTAIPRSGDVVCGKYRVDGVIGSGGMGVVVRAIDLSLNRPVAIKFLAPERALREGAVARFLREARAAAAIQSEHVVRVFEVSTLPNGAPFIVMEHLQGVDLGQELDRRGALPIGEACDLLLQACEAIGEAHVQGIVHRDLKPQNLFLTRRADGSPLVKVLDFGISKTIDEGSANLTSTDTVMGTPLYMSPEQVRSLKNVDARADIWALGAILFELLTMAPVFDAPTASALSAMIAMDPPTPLRARRPDAPVELEAVILRCLHKDPSGRFQNVGAFAEALVAFASDRGRASALRVTSLVRNSGAPQGETIGPAAQAGGFGTTRGPGHSAAPSGPSLPYGPTVAAGMPMAPPHPSSLPSRAPQAVPTTLESWQQHTNQPPAQSSTGLFVGLGAIGVLALLGVASGGAYVYAKRTTQAQVVVTSDAGAPAATSPAAPPPTQSVAPPATNSATSAPTASAKPPSAKDAGAPKDAGSSSAEDQRNADLGRMAEQQCKYHHDQMGTFARTDAARKQAATTAKGFMCRGMSSSRCERQTCREACLVLNDQPCLQQIDFVIDHGPAPKY